MENKDTMQLFEDKKIRSVWDAEKEEWFLFHSGCSGCFDGKP